MHGMPAQVENDTLASLAFVAKQNQASRNGQKQALRVVVSRTMLIM